MQGILFCWLSLFLDHVFFLLFWTWRSNFWFTCSVLRTDIISDSISRSDVALVWKSPITLRCMKFHLRRNLYYKSSSCSKISVYPTPSHFAVFPYRCYHFLAAGAGRPEHVVYEASKMLLTPLTLMKETTLTMEGTSFPSFPSSAGTESFNSSLLPCFIRYAGEAVENQSIQRS